MESERIKNLREALQFSPGNIPLVMHLASELMNEGNEAAALIEYKKILDIDSNNIGSKFGMAKAHYGLGNYSTSAVILEELCSNSAVIEHFVLLAKVNLKENSLAEAQAAYQKVLEIDTSYSDEELDEKLRRQETSQEKDFEDEEYVLSEDDDDGDLDELNADPKTGTAERNETLPNSTPVPFKPSLDFAKSRVNKWPSKPVKKVEAPVEAEKKLETLGASTSANPPPPVSVSGVNTNHNQLKNSQSNHKRPRYEPSPERTRSPPPRGDSRENRPRSGHRREDGRGDRRDRDGRREGRDSRDNRDNRESDRGRNRPASGSGHGRMNGGGRGGFSSSTPVDKWGDPIKSTNGDGQKRGRNTWDTRDRLVRSPARARSPRGRSRSRSPAKVRSLVRRSPSPEKIRSPVR